MKKIGRLLMFNERGIAMVTVLFVGAILTALASLASFTTIQEFRSSGNDQRSTEALAVADGGVDRFIEYVRSGTLSYHDLFNAGCDGIPPMALPEARLGASSLTSGRLEVFDPNTGSFGAAACAARPDNVKDELFVAITSEGEAGAARRKVLQVLSVTSLGLPIGHFANYIEANGNPSMRGVSMISETDFRGRNKIAFVGNDPYYTRESLWPDGPWPGGAKTDPVPAGAHALGTIYVQDPTTGQVTSEFQTATKNCNANDSRNNGIPAQSLWDSAGSPGSGPITSGCPGSPWETVYPNSSKFTTETLNRMVSQTRLTEQDHKVLKDAAMRSGIYCYDSSASRFCRIRNGTPFTPPQTWQDADVAPMLALSTNFILYYEFPPGDPLARSIKWSASNVWACADNKMATVIVRHGGYSMASSSKLNGAIIVDGRYDYTGGPQVNGTIIAQEIKMGGGATFTIDQCWLDHLPSAFSQATPVHWSELDR